MVTFILRSLVPGVKVLTRLTLLLLLPARVALASTIELAPGLEIAVPAPVLVSVVEAPAQINGPVLVGEIEGAPGYLMAAVRVRTWERNDTLWSKLEAEIRSRSGTSELSMGARGSFATKAGDNVWYRLYEYESNNQKHRQVYYLLKGRRAVYWLTVTAVEDVRVSLVMPIATALIRRARVAE